MQNSLLKVLSAQIKDELTQLDETYALLERRVSWLSDEKITDPYLIEDVFAALALTMHSFYTGCERILIRLISNIDGGMTKSGEWHRQLLRQASLAIHGVRAPIISTQEVYEFLYELRGLRHVIRNVYTNQLKPESLLDFGKRTLQIYPEFKRQVEEFMSSLESEQAS